MAQLSVGNFRFRGWRRSADLVEIAHAVPTDLKRTVQNQLANESQLDSVNAGLIGIGLTQVAKLQHLRVQVQYRTEKDSG